MELKDFNEQYKIETLVVASQPINEICLQNDEEDPVLIKYGDITDVHENIEFSVYEKTTNTLVFTHESNHDTEFLSALAQEFDIEELKDMTEFLETH